MLNLKKQNNRMIEKTFYSLGTLNRIGIFDQTKRNAVNKAIERVVEIDRRMSAFRSDSDISNLSRNSGFNSQKMHKDTFQLLQKAIDYGNLSDGAFDITIRPLVELWGINRKGNYIPSEEEIKKILPLVNYRELILDFDSGSGFLKKAGQSLDLGGIAKGYAADEVKQILLESGVESALINLGGNVVTVGNRPDGQPWQIGIQNPLAPTGHYLGILSVSNKTVVTSGSNERFFIKDGKRYHHILDPRTGKPAQNSLLSVTIICDSSADADALTTALFLLGPEQGARLLIKVQAEAIFIEEDFTVTATQGLQNSLKFTEMSYEP